MINTLLNTSSRIKYIFLLLLALGVPCTTLAQTETVTIGDGTSASYDAPIGTWHNYSITEQLYTATEIGMAGTIQKISFYYALSVTCDIPITVYMKHVDATSLSSGISLSDATEVFSGNFSVSTSGWTTIELDTPFEYNGTQNLLIGVNKAYVDYNIFGSSGSWRYTSTSSTYMARYTRSDSSGPYTTSTTPESTTYNRPNIQLEITPLSCDITYELHDSYGDGWNGCSLTVNDASTDEQLASWTISSGSSASGSLSIRSDRQVKFVFHVGSWAKETSFEIYDPSGNLLCQHVKDDNGPSDGQTWGPFTISCSSPSYTITAIAWPTNEGGSTEVTQNGAEYTLTATPTSSPQYEFVKWVSSDGQTIVSTDASYTITPSSDETYIAVFRPYSSACTYNVPFTEDFEDYSTYYSGSNVHSIAKPCWDMPQTFYVDNCLSPFWWVDGTIFSEGNGSLEMKANSGKSVIAVMPEFTQQVSTLQISFDYNTHSGNTMGTLYLGYWKNNAFTSITTIPTSNLATRPNKSTYNHSFANDNVPNGARIALKYTAASSSANKSINIDNIEVKPSSVTVSTEVYPSGAGTASGGGPVSYNGSCTLTASANTGWQFVNWTGSDGNVVSSNASYQFNATSDETYTANFTKTTVTALPWNDGFETGYPDDHSLLFGEWATPLRFGGLPKVMKYTPRNGTHSMEMRQGSGGSCMVVLPQFDKPLNSLLLEFYCHRGNNTSGYTGKLGYVDPSNNFAFTEITTITAPGTSYAQRTFDLSSSSYSNVPSSTTYRLAIKYTKTGNDDSWYFDDFHVESKTIVTATVNPTGMGRIGVPGTGSASTQEVGVGGTATNSYLPAYTLYDNTLSQQIYTPSEIGAAGTITSIAFYNGGSTKTSNYNFYLLHTSKSSFASTSDWITVSNDNLVYQGDVTMTAGTWTTITLSTPFLYNGADNLALVSNMHMSCTSGLSCRVFSGNNNSSMYVYKDGTAYDATSLSSLTASGRSSNKNQLQLGIIPLEYTTNFSREFSDASSSLTLIAVPNEGYAFSNWTEGGSTVTSDAIYTFTVDGSRDLVANFYDPCIVSEFPWTEDFGSYSSGTFSDPCWQNQHISGGGSSLFSVYSNHQLYLPDMSSGTLTKLRLPKMSIPTSGTYVFTLDVQRNTNSSSYTGEGIRVYASANGEIEGATELGFISRNYTVADTDHNIPAESSSGWYTYNLPIPITGTCYIILRGESKFGSDTYMDNFAVQRIYTLTVNPASGSTISVNGTTVSSSTSFQFVEGSTVNIEAVPATGYIFSGWTASGATVTDASSASTTLTMGAANATLTASFAAANTYTVNFETGALDQFAFVQSNSYPWIITTTHNGGSYAMKSGNSGTTSTTSFIEATVDFATAGAISFYSYASSESGYDYGRFYIDGVEMFSESGQNNTWTQRTYNVTSGPHIFKWSFNEDTSNNYGDDCFYVDDIVF